MTNQEKKQELMKYREAETEAARLEGEILRWYSKAEKMTAVVKLTPVGGGAGRRIESAVEEIDALAGKLADAQLTAVRLRRKLEDVIAVVPDGRLRMLLRYRYIDGMTWERIAESMGLELRWTHVLHGRALSEIKTL